jgi:hypothetical protein
MVEVELEISGRLLSASSRFGGGALKLEAPIKSKSLEGWAQLCTCYD